MEIRRRLRNDPVAFARLVLGVNPVDYQADILRAIAGNRQVAIRSGRGIGKSLILACAGLHFLTTNPHSIVVTTATTWHQVHNVLWKEIGTLFRNVSTRRIGIRNGLPPAIGLGGKLTADRLEYAQDWFMLGMSTNEKERFQGIHARRVMLIVDEGSGVSDDIFEAGAGMLTGEHDRLVVAGNPTRSTGKFYQIFHDSAVRSLWKTFHVDDEDLPWVRDRQPPPAPGLVTYQWVEAKQAEWGRDSPTYMVQVRGEFDERAEKLLMPLFDVEMAASPDRRSAMEAELDTDQTAVIGVDVGWTGDKTVITRVAGNVQTGIEKHHGNDPMEVVGLVIRYFREYGADAIVVDSTGIGAGVYSRLAEMNFPVIGFDGAAAPYDREMCANARAEAYWGLAIDIKDGRLAILDDDELVGQLAYQPTKTDSHGRLLLVSKDVMRREGRTSPDCADALAMANYGQRILRHQESNPGGVVQVSRLQEAIDGGIGW